MVGTHAVEEIAAAARETVASGSARVHARVFSDPPQPPEHDFGSVQEGVTDFARRRTRAEERPTGRGWESLVGRFVARWPWLDDLGGEEDDGEDEQQPVRIVYAGTNRYVYGDDRGWCSYSGDDGDDDASARHTLDPAWIVGVLAGVDGACERAAGRVGGEPCRRFGFGIDLRRHLERLALRSQRPFGNPHLAGDVWIDAAGRIRRVTWTSFAARRPRSPLRDVGVVEGLWRTTELSAFGLAVDIEVPVVVEDDDRRPWPLVLWQLSGAMWRAKRAYGGRVMSR